MHYLKVILVGASSLALIWILMVWVLAPAEVTNPYLPNFLQRASGDPPQDPVPEKKITKVSEPKKLDLTDASETHAHDANATQSEHPTKDEKNEAPETADGASQKITNPKPEPTPKPPKPREPPPNLENSATLALIVAQATDDRELKTLKLRRKKLLCQGDKPFTGWSKRMQGNSGKVVQLGQYRDGIKDGPHASWYSGKRFRELSHYREGKRNGLSVTWYGSRKKRDAIHYENDIKHGPATTWFSSGKKSAVGHYRHGEKDGIWITFKSNGQENRKQAYENGNPLDE